MKERKIEMGEIDIDIDRRAGMGGRKRERYVGETLGNTRVLWSSTFIIILISHETKT